MREGLLVDRRAFLKAGATAAGGLFVGLYIGQRSTSAAAGVGSRLGAFVEIDPQGAITIVAPRPEIGQGVATSLPMLIAEELDADWSRVSVRAPERLDPLYLDQFAGGSTSVHDSWLELRRVGAAARSMLVLAAAKRWGVAPGECTTDQSVVSHRGSGRKLTYAELAGDASLLTPSKDASVKAPSQFRLIGKRTRRTDVREIVTGKIEYGIDLAIPGMLVAAVQRCPVFGGIVRRFDGAAALQVPGVRNVIALPQEARGARSGRPLLTTTGVAVLADSTWAALKGRDALKVEWDERGHGSESSDALRRRSAELARLPPKEVLRDDGHFEDAFASAKTTLEAEYRVPFVEASPMEPQNCTADSKDGGCEIWAPTQNPDAARAFAASILGIEPGAAAAIPVHVLRAGGGFGRRLDTDYVSEAAWLSREAGAPVKVVWTREDELRHSPLRTMGHHFLRAALDAEGRPTAWSHHLVNPSRYSYQHSDSPPRRSEIYADDFPAQTIANFRVGYTPLECGVPRGYFRSMVHSSNNFVIQSFLDEIAHAAKRDPLELRRDLLGKNRDLPYADHGGPAWNTGRMRAVLDTAAKMGHWGEKLPAGSGRGIGCGFVFGSYAAEVAELSVDARGKVRVHRVVAAVDPGIVVNPLGIEAQVAGAVLDGINLALNLEISIKNGRVEQGNFDDYRFLRIDEAPKIEVHIVESGAEPWGIGETGVPPAVSAVANALFAATGRRVRSLPVRPSDVRAGSASPGRSR